VVSELWHTSQDDSKSTLGSLLQQYVPISRSRSDETTCLAYERLTASLLSRPIRPAQVVENYFLMMKQANVILFARGLSPSRFVHDTQKLTLAFTLQWVDNS
jgi:hypothetical protein